MGHREEFAGLVARPEAEIPLDQAWALLTAVARPTVGVDELVAGIDAIADDAGPDLDGLLHHLFVRLGFRGNQDDYYDPANTFLDAVVQRRTGIPISLSVLTMEVGRRWDLGLVGVGLPGHFLLRVEADPDAFVDPFHGGRRLDRAGCVALVQGLHGPGTDFDPAWLEPVGPRAVLERMLANLVRIFEQRGDTVELFWARDLQVALAAARGDHTRRLRLRSALN